MSEQVEDIRPEWVGDAAETIAGYRIEDGDYSLTMSFAEAHDIAERALAAVVPAIQAQALTEAARAWQMNGWAADLPKGSDRVALILGMAQRATDFMLNRAKLLIRDTDDRV